MYDHSVRVPFVVVGPDVPRQTTIDAPIYLQDIMPTTLELAGVDKPEEVEFQSLLKLVLGEETSHYDAIYGAYIDLQRMVTVDDFKLILYPRISKARLYNLQEDPLEMNDLSDDPNYAGKLSELFVTLLKLQQHTGDKLQLEKQFAQLASAE